MPAPKDWFRQYSLVFALYLIGKILSILEVGLEYHEHMKKILPIGIQLLRLGMLATLVIVLLLVYFPKTRPPVLRQVELHSTQLPSSHPFGSLYSFEIDGMSYDVLIEADRVLFQPFEGTSSLPSFTIDSADYPKLFEQGVAKASFHKVFKVGKGKDMMVEISNNQPDHGSYSPTYTLLINPRTKEVAIKPPQAL